MKRLAIAGAVLLGVPFAVFGLALLGLLGTGAPQAAGGAVDPAKVPAGLLRWINRAGAMCPEVTPAVIAAQLKAESGFRAQANSSAGAQGIAQFMPATWRTWGVDADGDGEASPWSPADAVMAQGRLICANVAWAKTLLSQGRAQGTALELALAAYNAGPAAVEAFGGVPPFPETAAYVKKVIDGSLEMAPPPVSPDGGTGWTLPLPVGSYTLSSGFGLRWGRLHEGQDFSAATGTPVSAAAAGTVRSAGCTSPRCDIRGSLTMPGCGNQVDIDHGGGVVTRYCHLERYIVASGQTVRVGEVIGYVGATGHVTGPHLHLEVWVDNSPRDPSGWLGSSSVAFN